MEISLLQAFALGILAFIAGTDMFNGLTHMHRPVVLGPLVGLILGDLHTGILTGGTLELVWMGWPHWRVLSHQTSSSGPLSEQHLLLRPA